MKHRFLVASEASTDSEVIFSADQAHQLQHVLRLRTGDHVRVFDGVEPVDRVVELVGPARGRVVGVCAQAAEPRTRLVVYPALLQRDKFEQVLQALTTLGVSAIVPVLTSRALVRQMPDMPRLARWQAIVREAVEQCGRGVVPTLGPALAFEDAVAQAAVRGRVVMAHEGERQATLHDALLDTGADVALFVGPEGGYAPEEVMCARSAGARLVTLGPRVLRTETASPVLAALVLYELGDLSSGPA
jgi:16S rRNA (uracil1498-N3)-methyltransferase